MARAVGGHVFDPETLGESDTCVCGWIIREALARECNLSAEDVDAPLGTCEALMEEFGGDFQEWNRIFLGVVDGASAPIIEEALFDRVMAAAVRS